MNIYKEAFRLNQFDRIEKYLLLIKKYPHIINGLNELEIITDKDTLYREQENLYCAADIKNQPRDWYDLGIVAQDAWVVVIRDLVRFPNGKYGGYIRILNRRSQLEQSGKDVVVLVKIDSKFLLMKHFRHDDRLWHWECPRGYGEQNLSPRENALKEIQEETGLTVNSIQQLDDNNERVAYFVVDCSGDVCNSDKYENISETILVDIDEFKNMIADCKIDDMYTLRAFILYELKR